MNKQGCTLRMPRIIETVATVVIVILALITSHSIAYLSHTLYP
jgi:hypothetical protein